MNQKVILYITLKNNKFRLVILFIFYKSREYVGYDIRIDTASIKSFKFTKMIHLYKLI